MDAKLINNSLSGFSHIPIRVCTEKKQVKNNMRTLMGNFLYFCRSPDIDFARKPFCYEDAFVIVCRQCELARKNHMHCASLIITNNEDITLIGN
jgi:hypothetical protein